jgi:hypothetical protein
LLDLAGRGEQVRLVWSGLPANIDIQTVRTIEASEEESQALTDSIAELLAEMGPRAIL